MAYAWIALFSTVLAFASFALIALSVRQRNLRLLPLGTVVFLASYLTMQCLGTCLAALDHGPAMEAMIRWLLTLPLWTVAGALLLLAVAVCAMFCVLYRQGRDQISSMSVKEAADSLPSGLCFYLPGGRIILVNRAMEHLCRQITGDQLTNGEQFWKRLFSDSSQPIKRPPETESAPLFVLADGTAWSFIQSDSLYRGAPIHMLVAADVTELYQKTCTLRSLQDELAGLNQRLTVYYQDAAALTTQKEILEARVRLHDEMGATLLMMQRYLLQGGTEEDRSGLESRLRSSISFLKSESPAARDEIRMIFDAAGQLNVSITIHGQLPETEPQRHILATALHECLTNTLRHAHGDALDVTVAEEADNLCVSLTNNGEQPTEPIRELGGLRSLRTLVQQAGGKMTVSISPVFMIRLELPKEVPHAL